MKLLALDTTSAQCSAALWLDGALQERAVETPRDHARLLLPMVDALLQESGLALRQLDGIAFGRGPGSFTGLRIAAAVTQGLAAGAGLPVLPVSSLRALALQASRRSGGAREGVLLACLDARMGEIYWGHFAGDALVGDEMLSSPEDLRLPPGVRVSAAAGKGLAAYPQIADSLQLAPQQVFADAEPHARDVAALAEADLQRGAQWVDAALAQPVYLRNDVTQAPKPAAPGAL